MPLDRPLRVLHLEGGRELLGGGRQVAHLVTGLAQQGVENVVVCPRGSRLAQALAEIATSVETLPMRGDLDLATAWHVAHIARRYQPDLVHVHSRRSVQWLGGLAARAGHLPVIYSRRTDAPERRSIGQLKYALYDRVIAISSCIAEQLRQVGVPPTKLRLVFSGVDAPPLAPASRAELCREFKLPADALVIGSIGQLIRRKGHAVLLEAVAELRPRIPNIHVLIFGRGELEAPLRRLARALDLAAVVQLVGFRPDVRRFLPEMDLVVHPALAEGLGVALLETAAAGVPMVASATGGIPDLVKHEETGLLVEPGNIDALATAIERMLTDADLRKACTSGAGELLAGKFTREQMVAGNLAVYREVLAERATSRRAA
jgi:glycosyltransferase involved in cell wall biosynthesis